MARIDRKIKPRKPEVEDDFGESDKEAKESEKEDDYFFNEPVTLKMTLKKKNKKAVAVVENERKVVELGSPRKGLSKKAESLLEDWRGPNHGKKVDDMIVGHLTQARKQF